MILESLWRLFINMQSEVIHMRNKYQPSLLNKTKIKELFNTNDLLISVIKRVPQCTSEKFAHLPSQFSYLALKSSFKWITESTAFHKLRICFPHHYLQKLTELSQIKMLPSIQKTSHFETWIFQE